MKQVQRGKRVAIANRGESVADLVPSASGVAQQTIEALDPA